MPASRPLVQTLVAMKALLREPEAASRLPITASAAPGGGAAGAKVAGDGEAKTWARSQIRSNTARLSIGDREELPLVGMQMNVQVEGFRARVVLDRLAQRARVLGHLDVQRAHAAALGHSHRPRATHPRSSSRSASVTLPSANVAT